MIKIKGFNLKKLDNVTKIIFILLVSAIVYLAVFLIIKPIFYPKSDFIAGMMGMMNFSSGNFITLNMTSLIIAIVFGFFISLYLSKTEGKSEELKIIKKALSEDEKRILNEIEKAVEITQDSLRFRLNWSKAKISTILTNLDKINLIQRERQGKTYTVFLSKK